jgi:ribosomal protein S18 acetylase RimI-like enzyme
MKFELSPELVDQIIFAMEDQENEYYLDLEEGVVVPAEELIGEEAEDEEERYLSLPEWRSVDGFNLMERFTATLRNPLYRERLRQILSSGRGVFRQFKNALKERPDIERLWFRFKNREMRKEVYRWYNALRESWGLKEVEIDWEEPEDLLLSDFRVERWASPEEGLLLELDRKGFQEMVATLSLSEAEKEGLYRSKRFGLSPSHPDSIVFQARSPSEELVAFLWAMKNKFRTDVEAFHILQLYCKPEYRGIGLSKALLEAFCSSVLSAPGNRVTIELLGTALDLAEFLENTGFRAFSQVLEMDAPTWKEIHQSVEPM